MIHNVALSKWHTSYHYLVAAKRSNFGICLWIICILLPAFHHCATVHLYHLIVLPCSPLAVCESVTLKTPNRTSAQTKARGIAARQRAQMLSSSQHAFLPRISCGEDHGTLLMNINKWNSPVDQTCTYTCNKGIRDKQSKGKTGENVVLLQKERSGGVCACSNTLWNEEN